MHTILTPQREIVKSPKIALPENQLLANLPRKDYQRLLDICEHVHLRMSEVLYEPDKECLYAYFPLDCFISLITTPNGKNRLEVSMAGNEGMLGTPLILGLDMPLMQAVVQGSGTALRIDADLFRQELESNRVLKDRLQRYIYVVMRQLAQTATCMRFHLLEERLARWLLMTQDRSHSNRLHLTQEYLSHMLGVRRVGISKAATNMQKKKLISYTRGEIKILNRSGLIAASCSCYQSDIDHYHEIMNEL